MLKNTILTSLQEVFKDRYVTILCGVMLALMVAFIIYIFATVRPSELQLVTHYTAFGVTHLYRDQWFYLLSFAGFGLLVGLLQVAVTVKAHVVKGRSLSLFFAWLGIGTLLFAWLTAAAIINVWLPV